MLSTSNRSPRKEMDVHFQPGIILTLRFCFVDTAHLHMFALKKHMWLSRRSTCCYTDYDQRFTFRGRYRTVVANNSSVLMMTAIMHIPPTVFASRNAFFITTALDIVQPNWVRSVSFSKICLSDSVLRSGEIQHPAYNCSFPEPPVIVTDRSPLPLVMYFNAAFIGRVGASKTHHDICRKGIFNHELPQYS